MKNVVIVMLVMGLVVVGYIAAKSNLRLNLEGMQGKKVVVKRGDLTLPINATGEVRPGRRVEIKAEASGEVLDVFRQPGDLVAKGELLVRLQRDDEERNVDRAQQEVNRAAAMLETAKIVLEQTKTTDIVTAQARIDQLEASVEMAQFRKRKCDNLREDQRHPEEVLLLDTTLRREIAALESARADLKKVRLSARRAEQEVVQAQAAYDVAQATLGDAQKRLDKTDIEAPIGGILADVYTQVGEVIQGGKSTFTGGTLLAVVLDTDKLIVRAEADEADIGRVLAIAPPWAQPGNDRSVPMPDLTSDVIDTMEHLPVITVESFREEEFLGVIERIYPEPKTLAGVVTYLVDVVVVSDNKKMLLPGMRADAEFTSDHVENVLLVPNEAVREGSGGKLGVYVPTDTPADDGNDYEFVACVFGLDNGSFSEVKEGLTEGSEIYTKLPVKTERQKKNR